MAVGSEMRQEHGPQGTPTWFGPTSAPLFGVVHVPVGGVARGGVVICPPLGREHLDTYRGLKLLAQRMCGAGFAVLRFDYRGTGDSSGEQIVDGAIDDYLDSVGTAADYLRDSGVQNLTLVGLRIGSLIAATAATMLDGVSGLVLWDPVTDGRKFMREQRVLYKMTAGGDEPVSGTEPILGITFSSTAAKRLGSLKMPGSILEPARALLLVRTERADDPRLHDWAEAPNCTLADVSGQPDFVEAASTAVVKIPMEAVDGITDWLDSGLPSETRPFTPTLRRDSVIEERPDGHRVVETLEELGPHRLFAIRTTATGVTPGGPTLLLHNTACEHRVGSGRIWPDTARELAALGMTVVRYDRRGIGDTGLATGEYAWIHSDVANADVVDATTALNVAPDKLMMSGICSGAWNSAYAALDHGAKSIILVNLLLYSLRRVDGAPERLIRITPGAPDTDPVPEGRAKQLVKHMVRTRLPYRGWLLLGWLGFTQAPEVLMKALARKGVSTELVLSPSDLEWYEGHRGPVGMARLARRGWAPKLVVAPTGDHAALQRNLQLFVRRYLVEAVQREFAGELSPTIVMPESAARTPSRRRSMTSATASTSLP